MPAKHFSLEEARSALPRVKQMMHEAQLARQEILRSRPDAWPALRAAASNGGGKAAGEVLALFTRLEANIKGIIAMGIHVKDIDQGLVDFLGRRDGREILLCWRYGEDDIAYWHELDAGFAGRRPIDSHIQ